MSGRCGRVAPFLVLMVGLCVGGHSASAQSFAQDLVPSTIEDERGNQILLYIPESLSNAQGQRRLYGTPGGFGGLFETLYAVERRTESYKAALRELALQPLLEEARVGDLRSVLRRAGVAAEDVQRVLDVVEQGAASLNTAYVQGRSLSARMQNTLASVGRKLEGIRSASAFAEASIALSNVEATAELSEVVAGAVLFHARATDRAEQRLRLIREAVTRRREPLDPALLQALRRAETELVAARRRMGAFAVSVTNNLGRIRDSAVNLGAALTEMSLKLSVSAAMWIGAPLMTYNTLRGISSQWKMAQDATTIATLTIMLGNTSEGSRQRLRSIRLYGQYAFYAQMEEALSTTGANFRDFLSSGQTNEDWSTYYARRKRQVEQRLRGGRRPDPSPPVPNRTFTEDWESGRIDRDRWAPFGSPSPTVVSRGHEGGHAFDAKGDSWCDSGVETTKTFSVQGRRLSFWGKVPATYDHFQDVSVGIAGDNRRGGSCSGLHHTQKIFIDVRGDQNRLWVKYQVEDETVEERIDRDWHKYAINVLESGRVVFYRDGQRVYRSKTTVRPSLMDDQHLFVSGRSQGRTPVLIDEVVLRTP